jgi:hypothetical protein
MKESYGEGLATHTGHESCGATCEGGIEALTGARAGWVWSRETTFQGRTKWDFVSKIQNGVYAAAGYALPNTFHTRLTLK